jgi:hypothetical protein
MNYVQLILSLATRFGCKIYQMDVKIAFLHGYLTEEIFILEQTHGFMIYSNLVFQINKSLYGLNQAP